MSEENKYLKLARAAREEENAEDAKKFYDMVRAEDPENPEAKFFYQYYTLMNSKNGEIPNNFSKVCSTIIPTIKLIQKTEYAPAEKIEITNQIVEAFLPLTFSMLSHMRSLSCFDYSDCKTLLANGIVSIGDLCNNLTELATNDKEYRNLALRAWKEKIDAYEIDGNYEGEKIIGNTVASKFAQDTEAQNLAATAWKTAIDLRFKHSLFVKKKAATDRWWVDDYAEKIQKIDPQYKIPAFELLPTGFVGFLKGMLYVNTSQRKGDSYNNCARMGYNE